MAGKHPFLFILGMHRSGTSCLAGALQACGLYLGKTKGRGRHNRKGYFEIEEIYLLHESVMRDNEKSWFNPPSDTMRISTVQQESLLGWKKYLDQNAPAGIKDPRLLFFLEEWKAWTEGECRFAGSFRHPLAVAHSLKVRNNMPLAKGLKVWAAYNQRLVAEHKRHAFPLIEYDLSVPADYRRRVKVMAKMLGLRPSPLKLWWFIDKRLEHQHSDEQVELPERINELYRYLQKNAIQ